MIIYLFGISGAGKSFIGSLMSKELGWYLYDGDLSLSNEDIEYLKMSRFTEDMRDSYHDRLMLAIKKIVEIEGNIIVTSCLLKQRHRNMFYENFKGEIEFIQICVDSMVAMERVKGRTHTFTSESAFLRLLSDNEPVSKDFSYLLVNNNGEIFNFLDHYPYIVIV